MNEFKFACPNCQQNIQATPEYVGAQINCPNCQVAIVVPEPAAAMAAPKPGRLSMAPSTVQHAATSPVMATKMAKKAKKQPVGLYVGLGVTAVVAVAAIIFVPKALDKYHQHQEEIVAAKVQAEAAAKAAAIPPEPTANEILKKVGATYKGLTSYGAQGKSVATVDVSQINPAVKDPQIATTTLSILLGRPDLYRMEWEKQAGQKTLKGAAWSAGKGDFVRTGAAATKMKSRQLALATAGGASGTISAFLVTLFFDETNSLSASLKNYSKKNNETLNGRKCYVLSGQIGSQNLQFWIRKDDSLIAQTEVVLGGKIDDSAMAGLTAVQKAQMQMLSKLKGNIIETYDNIETNKVLAADAFQIAFTPNTFTPNATPKRKGPGDPRHPGGPGRGTPQ